MIHFAIDTSTFCGLYAPDVYCSNDVGAVSCSRCSKAVRRKLDLGELEMMGIAAVTPERADAIRKEFGKRSGVASRRGDEQ